MEVTNQGTFNESTEVTLADNGTNFASQSIVNLAPGESTTLVFSWTTNNGTALGSHTLTAHVVTVSGETDVTDNTATASVSVIDVPPPPIESTIDDGDAGYSKTASGWSVNSSALAYNGDYDRASGGNGSAVATWSFAGLPAGQYEVYATWVSHPKKQASNAPYSVLGNTVFVNQRNSPDGAQITGWQRLTSVSFDGNGNLNVRLSNNANGIVVADAIRVVPVQASASIGQSLTVASPSSTTRLESPTLPPGITNPGTTNRRLPVDDYFATLDNSSVIPLTDKSPAPQSSQTSTLDTNFESLKAELPDDDSLANK